MSDSKVCPNCQHENSAEAVKCEKCGAVLPANGTETVRFGDLAEVSAAQRKAGYQGKVVPGFLAVYVMDDTNPLLFPDRGTLTIGRSALGEEPPIINLTRHYAGVLGVSRRHASIQVTEHEHTLTDLNSSNGTWVNQEPLIPGKPRVLRSGDSLRLGHLVLHIYFEEEGDSIEPEAPEQVITPVKPTTSELGAVHSATIRLVGRPGPLDYRQNQVVTRMLYVADQPEDGITALPSVPTRFTVYIPEELWRKVRDDLANPESQLVIEGTCTYGKESTGIVVHATQVSVQKPEAAEVKKPEEPAKAQPAPTVTVDAASQPPLTGTTAEIPPKTAETSHTRETQEAEKTLPQKPDKMPAKPEPPKS